MESNEIKNSSPDSIKVGILIRVVEHPIKLGRMDIIELKYPNKHLIAIYKYNNADDKKIVDMMYRVVDGHQADLKTNDWNQMIELFEIYNCADYIRTSFLKGFVNPCSESFGCFNVIQSTIEREEGDNPCSEIFGRTFNNTDNNNNNKWKLN
jgi:hypothetical protein